MWPECWLSPRWTEEGPCGTAAQGQAGLGASLAAAPSGESPAHVLRTCPWLRAQDHAVAPNPAKQLLGEWVS